MTHFVFTYCPIFLVFERHSVFVTSGGKYENTSFNFLCFFMTILDEGVGGATHRPITACTPIDAIMVDGN